MPGAGRPGRQRGCDGAGLERAGAATPRCRGLPGGRCHRRLLTRPARGSGDIAAELLARGAEYAGATAVAAFGHHADESAPQVWAAAVYGPRGEALGSLWITPGRTVVLTVGVGLGPPHDRYDRAARIALLQRLLQAQQ